MAGDEGGIKEQEEEELEEEEEEGGCCEPAQEASQIGFQTPTWFHPSLI